MQCLDIAQVARASGVPASTLRFYEEKGLIASLGRRGLRRLFAADVLERLALIALGRAAGFSLEEIGRVFADGARAIDRQLLLAKADELDRRIRRLGAMRDGLRHAAQCRAPSHQECPTFQRIVRAAASGALERRQADTDAAARGDGLTRKSSARKQVPTRRAQKQTMKQ